MVASRFTTAAAALILSLAALPTPSHAQASREGPTFVAAGAWPGFALRRPDIAMRRDIVEKKLEDIKKEAPFAYKGIGPIIETLTDAGIAQPVAELTPLMTVKG